MDLVFLDTETTGNDQKIDRLVQVCYKFQDKLFLKNFKPPVPISVKAMSITHITNEMVEKELFFAGSDFSKNLEDILENNILVAHNAKFDIAMLENEGLKIGKFICTLRLARYLDEDQEVPEYNLQFLRYYYGIKFDEPINPHSADGDVKVLEAVFGYLFDLAKKKSNGASEDEIIKRMIDISARPSLIKKFNFGKHNGKLVKDVAEIHPDYIQWLLKTKEEEGTDEDWIYTCKYYLGVLG